MPALGIAPRGDRAIAQGMPAAHDAQQPVGEQGLAAHLGAQRGLDDPGFQVHPAVTQRGAVLVRLLQEVQPHALSLLGDRGEQRGAEAFDEAVAGPQGEGSCQAWQIERLVGP